MAGKYYEEFTVGETIEHEKRRTVSEADNQAFCDLTMNQQPLHLDAAFAAGTQFGERLVNGLYTMALATGLSIPDTTDGTIVANLSYDAVEHPNPVFHGDTIYARSTVLDKRETSDGERGVVTMRVEAYKVSEARLHRASGEASGETGNGEARSASEQASGETASSEAGSASGQSDGEDGDPRDGAEDDPLVCEFERTVLALKRETTG